MGQWFPYHGIFGSWDVAWHTFASSFLGIDSNLLTSGQPAVADYDYGFSSGSQNPINIQGSYKVLRVRTPASQPGLGGDILLGTPNGGQVALEHLSSIASGIVPGVSVGGGQLLGYTGWPTDQAYSIGPPGPGNAHLAVIPDALGNDYLQSLAPNGELASANVFPSAPSGSGSGGSGGPFGFVGSALATFGQAIASYALLIGGLFVVSILILRQFGKGPIAEPQAA